MSSLNQEKVHIEILVLFAVRNNVQSIIAFFYKMALFYRIEG